MDIQIQITDVPDSDSLAVISDGLDQFNIDATGVADRRPFAVLAVDPDSGRTLGGVSGRSSLGLLFIDLFFLPPALRGDGLGSRLLREAEDEGRRRGCRCAVLYTISFQAPAFYQRHGWTVFGEIPCDPPGTSRIFLRKALRD